MSIILDALSRAEREKRSTDAPDILAVAPIEPRHSPVLFVVAGAALAFGILGTLWWVIVAGGEQTGADASASQSNGQAQSPVQRQPAPSTQRPQSQSRSNPSSQTSEIIVAPRDSVAEPKTESKTGAKPKPSQAVAALYAQPVPRAEGTPSQRAVIGNALIADDAVATTAGLNANLSTNDESGADASSENETNQLDPQEILKEVRAVEASSDLAPHPVPLLAALSKQYRDSVPTLIYLRHDFNSAGVSTVRINGEDLREGQRTRQVLVREILPDSVVLGFRETEFRLRALNSWVNL